MRRGHKRGIPPLAFGAIVIALVAVATYLGFTKEVPFANHYEVHAAFTSANNIKANSPVRVAGIDVGKVTDVQHAGDGEQAAIVTMRIDDHGLPLHRDATMTIRPRIFLEGNFFVDVQPGSPSAPRVREGETLPVNQTNTPVQLDQILTALQSDTREDLKNFLAGFDEALEGDGARGFNRSIRFWEPAYRDSAIVNEATLGEQEGDLSGYIDGAGAVAAALGRDGAQLKSLITDLNITARAFAVRDERLSESIGELPRLLRTGRPALAALNDSLPPLRRLVRDLRPGVRSSLPAIKASRPFVRQVRGLVSVPELRGLTRDLRPVVPHLDRLNRASVPLYANVRSTSSCQNEVILPWANDEIEDPDFPAVGKVFQEQTRFLPGIAGESRSGDANGQWFRVLVGVGNWAYPMGTDAQGEERFMLTTGPILGVNPPKPGPGVPRAPLRPDVPCETQKQPDLRTRTAPAPEGFRVDTGSDRARSLLADAEEGVGSWLRGRVRTEGLQDELGHLLKGAEDRP
jgi:virulence factor Mce-like protein